MNDEIEQQRSIINSLKTDYAIEVATLTFLPLGADLNASVYKAVAKNGTSYFVKQKRGVHNHIHLVILDLLHQANIYSCRKYIDQRKQCAIHRGLG